MKIDEKRGNRHPAIKPSRIARKYLFRRNLFKEWFLFQSVQSVYSLFLPLYIVHQMVNHVFNRDRCHEMVLTCIMVML